MEYKKELHPLFETLSLILLMKNFTSVKVELINSLDEMEIDGESFYKKNLSYLEGYIKGFEEKYISGPEEDFFFGDDTEFFLIVVAIVVEYSQLEADIDTLTDKEILHMIERFFAEDVQPRPAGLDTMEERFALVKATDYSEEAKWKLFTLLNHPLDKFKALFELYRRNKQAFVYTMEKNRECLETLLSEVPPNVSPVMEHLMKELSLGGVTIYLTAAFPLLEWLTSNTAFQGILANQLYLYKKGMEHAREILPGMLKVLGDKSKFDILYALKERGKYNLEIAKELGLTPATVSHHMGILLSHYFVMVEKREGRVYYRLNQESIRELTGLLEGIFGVKEEENGSN